MYAENFGIFSLFCSVRVLLNNLPVLAIYIFKSFRDLRLRVSFEVNCVLCLL